MTEYLETKNLLTTAQHGFRSGRSCLTNLMYSHQSWTKYLDEKIPVDVIYFDFSKAFDTVPHKMLLNKIKSYGIGGKLLQWICNFLIGRTQRVHVKTCFSPAQYVSSGVPQGSVLGPLLFLLYVNDIVESNESHIVMFADDIKIWRGLRTVHDTSILQNDINKLQLWSETWLLKFNVKKCVVLNIRTRKSTLKTQYRLHNVILHSMESEKDLGITIMHSLKSSVQCTRAANKAMTTMKRIKRALVELSPEVFCKVYNAYVRPHLEYAIQVWKPWLQQDINKLLLVQRRCTKLVAGLYNVEYSIRESILNLFPLSYRQTRGDLILAFRIIRTRDVGLKFDDFFQYSPNTYLRGHSWKLRKERSNYPLRKYFFSQRVVEVWNSLPESVVSAQSTESFKKHLDRHFFPNSNLEL